MKYRLQFNPGEIAYKPQIFTDAIKILVLQEGIIKKALINSTIKRFIYVPKRIVNLVI